jgi:hypothetical protein
VVASRWKHYQAANDTTGKSIAEVVEDGFWVIPYLTFCCPPSVLNMLCIDMNTFAAEVQS